MKTYVKDSAQRVYSFDNIDHVKVHTKDGYITFIELFPTLENDICTATFTHPIGWWFEANDALVE